MPGCRTTAARSHRTSRIPRLPHPGTSRHRRLQLRTTIPPSSTALMALAVASVANAQASDLALASPVKGRRIPLGARLVRRWSGQWYVPVPGWGQPELIGTRSVPIRPAMPVMQNRRVTRPKGGIASLVMLVVLAAGVAALRLAGGPVGDGGTLRRMERVLLDDIIRTDYGQFDIGWSEGAGFDGNWDRFFNGQVNGLVGAADPGGVYINLGRRSGGSRVRIVLLDGAPPTPLRRRTTRM